MRTSRFALLLPLLCAASLQAQERPAFTPAPPPPAMAEGQAESVPAATPGEEMAPEISVIRRKEEMIEEYRLNGRLYMVKITPKKGYPYYLIDTDGDGSLETRRNDLDNPPVVQWKLLQW